MNRTNKVIRLGRTNPIKSRLQLSEVGAAKLRLGMKTIATVQVYPAAEDAVYAQRAELILLVQVRAGDLADRCKTSVAVGRVGQRSQRGRPRISGKQNRTSARDERRRDPF